MKKRTLLILLAVIISILFSSCVTIQGGQDEPQASSKTSEQTPALPEASPVEQLSEKPKAPSPTLAATEAPTEENCAYITAMSMRMDGQTDITFDYVDWLSGDEAIEKYLGDHPGATEEEMEGEGIFEMGYVRNVSNKLRTFHTTPETEYFLPDIMDMGVNVEVSYDEFRDKMFPAVDMGVDDYLTFVNVKVKGDEIFSIEWLYTP